MVAAALARLANAVPRMGTAARAGDNAASPAAIAGAAKPAQGAQGGRERERERERDIETCTPHLLLQARSRSRNSVSEDIDLVGWLHVCRHCHALRRVPNFMLLTVE